ncbi:CAAX prenyl protease 2 [Scaptodrosophila lebanonensis]|uniref:CAAX prenyl protease 2 n=1 Tax=Drosophila lebanonensis TaxID=7225 RepID=A0A6J2TCT7_DROLE|nr:CAAX prenyl protease 2 [Scaptodrosophila lebanonensis]
MYNETTMRTETTTVPAALPMPQIPVTTSVTCCFILAVIYVGSLYVWSTKHSRDHPSTIKRRFASVSFVMLFAPFFVYCFSSPELLEREHFPKLLGFRWLGLWQAIVIPYLLTALLFLGPIFVNMQTESIRIYFDWNYWSGSFSSVVWLRNHVMAPLSEEFVFRACMMPLILQSFTPLTSVFITPLFFGVAHMHHIAERLSLGVELSTAVLIGFFQFVYTTLFGFYSAYLFARTGHIVAPFLVHAFCNHMGLPDVQELWQLQFWRRIVAIGLYIIGFAAWVFLLPVVTDPRIYANTLYWNV